MLSPYFYVIGQNAARSRPLADVVLINATNDTFWQITQYKPGQRLDMSNPQDRAMSKTWLDIYAQIKGRRDHATSYAQRILNETVSPYVLVIEQRNGSLAHRVFERRGNLDVQYAWLIDQPDYYTYAAMFDFTKKRDAPILDQFAMEKRQQTATSGANTMVGAADAQSDINGLHADIMRFGQDVNARVNAATDRIQQDPAHKTLRDQLKLAFDRIETLPQMSQERIDAVNRARNFQGQVAEDFDRRAKLSPILRWEHARWEPFRTGWLSARDVLSQRVGRSPGWGREYVAMVPGYRAALAEIQNSAPF